MSSNPLKGPSSHFWPISEFHIFFLPGHTPWDQLWPEWQRAVTDAQTCPHHSVQKEDIYPDHSYKEPIWGSWGLSQRRRNSSFGMPLPSCPHVVHGDSSHWRLHLIVFSEPSISHTSWVQNPVFKQFTCAPKFLFFLLVQFSINPAISEVFILLVAYHSFLCSACAYKHKPGSVSTPCRGPSRAGGSREGALCMSSRHRQPGIYNIKFWHLSCFTKCKLGLYTCCFHFVRIKLYRSG